MAVLRYLAPALVLASSVFAQCSTRGTLTITNTADATKLATCQTYTGSVAINSKAVGAIALDGPSKIVGNVVAANSKTLTGISASSLQSIEGTLNLTSLFNIDTVSFPMLRSVDSVFFLALSPSLGALGFTAGITSIKDLSISDTYLTSFEGIGITKADTVEIVNNFQISQLSLPFTEITSTLMVRGNNNGGLALSLPKLKNAGVVTINDCSAVSLPALTKTTGLIAVDGNEIKSLSFPKLTEADGFDVSGNTQLKKLSAPVLTAVGGTFSIAFNTLLGGTLSFPDLETVKGGPNITGVFTGLNLPKLKQVQGHATIISTKPIQNTVCAHFQSLVPKVLEGMLTCHGKVSKQRVSHSTGTHGDGSSGGGGSGGSSSNNNNHNAAAHSQASLSATLFVFGVSAASLAWLL